MLGAGGEQKTMAEEDALRRRKSSRGRLREFRARLRGKKVKTWVLILVLVPLLFLDATMLRMDHVKMTELRDAVLAADEQTDDVAVAEALVELKEFVFSHIVVNVVDDNGVQRVEFGTGPFYLQYTYMRDANKALEDAEAALSGDNNPYGNVYGQAGEVCKAQALANGWTWDNVNFINCMLTEIAKYPSADELQDQIVAELPSTELYRREYASPVWTFCISGWLILVTLVIIVVIFIRFVVWVGLRLSLLFV